MKDKQIKSPCLKIAASYSRRLSHLGLHTLCLHSLTRILILAVTIAVLAPLLLPTVTFLQSCLVALAVGAAFALSFKAIDHLLSSLLETPVLCLLTFNSHADSTKVIVCSFACFAVGYVAVAAFGLLLCNMLNIVALKSTFDFVAATALLIAAQGLLDFFCAASRSETT